MVLITFDILPITFSLSVLALSSRFDGPMICSPVCGPGQPFSTRSVESF